MIHLTFMDFVPKYRRHLFGKSTLQKQTRTLTVHFNLSTHPSEKLVFAQNGTLTHVSLITPIPFICLEITNFYVL